MSNQPQLENQNPEEVPCLMVPVADRNLLLPSVSVAEMVPFTSVTPVADSPEWLLGNFLWREQQVPLLSFEVMNGEPRADVHSRCRVAVLNNTGQSEKLPFMAIMAQGIPRLARATEADISENKDADLAEYELMHANLAGEPVVIPDLEKIERDYLALNL